MAKQKAIKNDGATDATPKRRPGKDIVPRLQVLDGASYILMASARINRGALKTALLWATTPKDPEKAFRFLFEIPSGETNGGSVTVSLPMGQAQAQAVYASHPRRVPKDDMPPECPLEAVIDPPRGKPGRPKANA